jgi:hypothetical protein
LSDKKSKLVFDGKVHQIALVNSEGSTIESWPAYNNVDSHATIRSLKNQTYTIQDQLRPHSHKADANGPYGLHGIIRFQVTGHPGIGVHSGRANAKHKPGPAHPTMGCIRTTDEAMAQIIEHMRGEPLAKIEVKNNTQAIAKHSSQRNSHIGHVSHIKHHG